EYIRRADQGDRTVPDQYENQIKRFEEEKEKILKERGVDPAAIGRGGPSPEMEAELRAIQSDCESRYKSIEESGDQADQGKLQALSKECSNRAKEVFRNYGFPVDAINEALDRTDMNLDFNQDGFGDPTGALPKEPPFVKDMEAVRKECEAEAKQIVVGGSGADAADALSDLDAKCRAKVKSIFEQAGVKGGIIGPGMDDEPGFDDPETRMPIELISALQSARKSCESRMNKAGEIGGIEGYEKAKSVFSDCKRTFESLFNKYGVPIPANPPWGKFDMPPPQEDKHNMDPNTGYPTGEYDPNRYDPNQDYYPKQDYDPNQDYYPKQDYDPNQDYDPKQDYNSNTDDTNDGSDTKSTSPPPVP
ncbi:MAG: hypothetical protein HYY09_04530, partial [Firmicutes bacterium]|nr:hypothetical protein [Bacillota bacterium]